jgi:hypothetical protein
VKRWGEFEILDEIGRGGFGTVYRAFHPVLAREIALKLIAVPDDQPREIERALEEARRLAKVRHRNVVTVHDARYLDGHVGICMELIQGQPLLHIVEHHGRFGADETRNLAKTLCRALVAIHRVGVIHSDVKAQNVMREDGGRIVLMDFGAGRQLRETDKTTRLQIMGTPAYMAPEIFRFKDPSPASDIYSLGVLLFYVLTRTFPIDGRSLEEFATAHAQHARRYLGDLRDDLPAGLIGIVEKALEPRRRDRYRTPGEMLADLSSGHVTGGAAHAGSPGPVRKPLPVAGAVVQTSTTSDVVDVPAPVRRALLAPALVKGTLIVGGLIAGAWLLGYLSRTAYDVLFGLSDQLAGGSVFDWLETGARLLVLPAFYMLVATVCFVVARFAWRLLDRLVPRAHGWAHKTTRAFQAVSNRTGLNDGAMLAGAVLTIQMVFVLAVYIRFHRMFVAITTPMTDGSPATYLPLAPANENEWLVYCGVTSVLALASASAWIALIRRRRAGIGAVSIAAGLVLTAVFAVMFAVPWRIIYQSTFQRASYKAQQPCYIVAERSSRAKVWCLGPARMHGYDVTLPEPGLVRSPYQENIFAVASTTVGREEGR